jgi:hypothetical protein
MKSRAMRSADEVYFRLEGTRRPDDRQTHIERINGWTDNAANVPGLDYVPPAGKGRYR